MADLSHVAEVNVALPSVSAGDEALDSFFELSESVNLVADSSPGFIWRPHSPLEISDRLGPQSLLITLSVWRSLEDLRSFVYKGLHAAAFRRRQEWFTALTEAHAAIWWIPAGTVPSLADAENRLIYLRKYGPTPYSFHLGKTFSPPQQRPSP